MVARLECQTLRFYRTIFHRRVRRIKGALVQRQLVFRSHNYIATQRLARMLRDNIDGKRPNIMQ